jgi:hypothetical protein
MVKFGKFESTASELTDLGTVKSVVGKGGKIALIRKNYNNPEKRVVVLMTNKKGDTAIVSCSKQVSDALRAKKLKIDQLVGLNVVESEVDGEVRQFISMPATGAIQSFDLDKIEAAEVATEEGSFLPQELIAF